MEIFTSTETIVCMRTRKLWNMKTRLKQYLAGFDAGVRNSNCFTSGLLKHFTS